MPLEIDGRPFLTLSELAGAIGVSRQTLWRWRRDGKIPSGHRFRDGRVVFAETETRLVRAHSLAMTPLVPGLDTEATAGMTSDRSIEQGG
jgi:predicted DNA-binding transcriptional regulator AlpA